MISQQAIYWQGSIPFCSTLEGNLGTIVKLAILKSREIATVAALTALGNAQPQLTPQRKEGKRFNSSRD